MVPVLVSVADVHMLFSLNCKKISDAKRAYQWFHVVTDNDDGPTADVSAEDVDYAGYFSTAGDLSVISTGV